MLISHAKKAPATRRNVQSAAQKTTCLPYRKSHAPASEKGKNIFRKICYLKFFYKITYQNLSVTAPVNKEPRALVLSQNSVINPIQVIRRLLTRLKDYRIFMRS